CRPTSLAFTFMFALFADETDAPGAYVALTDERGDRAGHARDTARLGLDDDAREPRVEREAQHSSAHIGHAARAVGRSQSPQQSLSRGDWERRSEEHTSELQSQSNLVCRLLLEKKKHVTRASSRT